MILILIMSQTTTTILSPEEIADLQNQRKNAEEIVEQLEAGKYFFEHFNFDPATFGVALINLNEKLEVLDGKMVKIPLKTKKQIQEMYECDNTYYMDEEMMEKYLPTL